MSRTEDAIQVAGVTKAYRSFFRRNPIRALNQVDLKVRRGAAFGLAGPNGAGKTTLMKIMIGAVRPSSGSVELFGWLARSAGAARLVGYLPETCAFPPYLTARQLLQFHGRLMGLGGRLIANRAAELLDRVGLADWADVPLAKYSKGMVQRAGIAQAMLHEPELLILDEPTDGLDPAARVLVLDLLRTLNRSGVTLFINSHLLDELQSLCDEVAILNHGEIVKRECLASAAQAGYVLTLSAVPANVLLALALRSQPVCDGDSGAVRLHFTSRVDLDWAIETVQNEGEGQIESLAPAGRSLTEMFLSATAAKQGVRS